MKNKLKLKNETKFDGKCLREDELIEILKEMKFSNLPTNLPTSNLNEIHQPTNLVYITSYQFSKWFIYPNVLLCIWKFNMRDVSM